VRSINDNVSTRGIVSIKHHENARIGINNGGEYRDNK